jgi:hypothetical protein
VFIVDALDRERTLRLQRRIRGLHWRYRGLNRGLRDREYVVVTRSAPLTTFAHEIGHLLGLRHHNSPDNIMCSCRRGSDLRFTPAQGEAMQAAAPRFSSQDHRRGGQAADRSRSKRRRR